MTQSFSKLGLAEPVLRALSSGNYVTPTPIQTKAIPLVLEGRDIFGIAQTGTGKTAAFALPIIDRLLANRRAPQPKGCRALVLSPTRELATQIANSFRTYGRFTKLTVTSVFGGVRGNPQVRALSGGVDILVATPGRLLDHILSGHCDLAKTELLVLDEADQMLDLGFRKPIRSIAARTPPQRQSLFFSATLPKDIEALAREMLRNPASVHVTPVSSTAKRVDQKVIHIGRARKAGLLVDLLADHDMVRTLVFARTKRGADNVTKHLNKCGLKASAIHGNKSQNQREKALSAFQASKIQVLVATDIAARGIDIPEVSHVVNYDLPETPEAYVHRIGRTARAGRSGQAISLCDPSERRLLRDIERLTKQTIPSERRTESSDGEDQQISATRGGDDGGRPRRGRGKSGATPSAKSEHRRPRRRTRTRSSGSTPGNTSSTDQRPREDGGKKADRSAGPRAGKAKQTSPTAKRRRPDKDRPGRGDAPQAQKRQQGLRSNAKRRQQALS